VTSLSGLAQRLQSQMGGVGAPLVAPAAPAAVGNPYAQAGVGNPYPQPAVGYAQPGVGNVAIMPQQVGAVQVWPQQVGIPQAQMVPQGQQQPPVQYAQTGYKAGGLTLCGFPRVNVPAGTTNASVQINVRRPFLPQLLYMPSTFFGLQLVDFDVEGTGLFASVTTQSVPNELVSEVSNMPQIQWPTLEPATGGAFIVSNPTGADIIFSGCFWGTNLIRA